jgi:hypothetical protein
MPDISPTGLLGAVIGTVVAAVAYRPLAMLVEQGLAALARSDRSAEFEPFERGLLLRVVFALDLFLFAGVGYWLGATIGG